MIEKSGPKTNRLISLFLTLLVGAGSGDVADLMAVVTLNVPLLFSLRAVSGDVSLLLAVVALNTLLTFAVSCEVALLLAVVAERSIVIAISSSLFVLRSLRALSPLKPFRPVTPLRPVAPLRSLTPLRPVVSSGPFPLRLLALAREVSSFSAVEACVSSGGPHFLFLMNG